MKKAITIHTTPYRYDFLQNCLSFLEKYDKYPVFIQSDYSYGIGKAQWFAKNSDIDEFVVVTDSMEILDLKYFDLFFDKNYEGKTVIGIADPFFYMGIAKFRSDVFNKMNRYIISTKREELLKEPEWITEYTEKEDNGYVTLWDFMEHRGKIEHKFGRDNVINKNKYFKKYKGCWSLEQAQDQLNKR